MVDPADAPLHDKYVREAVALAKEAADGEDFIKRMEVQDRRFLEESYALKHSRADAAAVFRQQYATPTNPSPVLPAGRGERGLNGRDPRLGPNERAERGPGGRAGRCITQSALRRLAGAH